MKYRIINIINTFLRFINGLRRPSKRRNAHLLRRKGEEFDSFLIRDATLDDIPALAALHVKTWNDTYGSRGPGIQTRAYQWNELFKSVGKNWFVLVIENKNAELVGFAKGQAYDQPELPEFRGELNKIYILRDYQRLGLGRKLVASVARRFLDMGINNMVLFGIPQNPSCRFHEAMGGTRLLTKANEFHGGYYWRDLERLVEDGSKWHT
jgi:GNAT superfamily N-acetyltransferase